MGIDTKVFGAIADYCTYVRVHLTAPDGSGGQSRYLWWSKPVPDTSVHVFEQELPPGRYGVDGWNCWRPYGGKQFRAAPNKVFAHFTVENGEIVDLGTMSLLVLSMYPKSEAYRLAHAIFPFVSPLPEQARTILRADVVDKLTTRHMQSSKELSPRQLQQVCRFDQNRRERLLFNIGPLPLCKRFEASGQ
jgi:hypothetical protein